MERLPHSDCTGHNVIVHDAVLWRGVRALQRDGVVSRDRVARPYSLGAE